MFQGKIVHMLDENPAYQKFLFQRGFLITNAPTPPRKIATVPFLR